MSRLFTSGGQSIGVSASASFQWKFRVDFLYHWLVWLAFVCAHSKLLQSCPALCDPMTAARQASVSFIISQSLLKFLSTELVMPSNHLIFCRSLLLLPSIFPSIRIFSNESALHISGQSSGASASAAVLPMNIQDWFPLGLNGLISLLSKGLSRVMGSTHLQMVVIG